MKLPIGVSYTSEPMRLLTLKTLLILLTCVSCSVPGATSRPDRVLFVGNSLTYYGNVPAVFAALAGANGKPIASDMIAKGGATLAERVADGSVARALDERKYTALVLQERGGDVTCSFGPESCIESRKAIKTLASLGKEKGVHVVLLGTFQGHPGASEHLVAAESSAPAEAGVPYIEVSNKLQRLRNLAPNLTWHAPDGVHPGKHLTLLNAILVHEALRGSLPKPEALTVSAPIYGSGSGLTEALRQSDDPPPRKDTPAEVRYSSDAMRKLIDAIDNEGGG